MLSDQEIQARVPAGWAYAAGSLLRTYQFENFVEAVAFVQRVVEPAEAANHHPDIAISYNKVSVTLRTHSEGAVTEKDLDLAPTIDAAAQA